MERSIRWRDLPEAARAFPCPLCARFHHPALVQVRTEVGCWGNVRPQSKLRDPADDPATSAVFRFHSGDRYRKRTSASSSAEPAYGG